MLLSLKEDIVYYYNNASERILGIKKGFTSVSDFRGEGGLSQGFGGHALSISKRDLKDFHLIYKNGGKKSTITLKKAIYNSIKTLKEQQ